MIEERDEAKKELAEFKADLKMKMHNIKIMEMELDEKLTKAKEVLEDDAYAKTLEKIGIAYGEWNKY